MSAAVTAWMLFSLLTGTGCASRVAAADAQRAARRPERWAWMGAMALIVVLGAMAPWRQRRPRRPLRPSRRPRRAHATVPMRARR